MDLILVLEGKDGGEREEEKACTVLSDQSDCYTIFLCFGSPNFYVLPLSVWRFESRCLVVYSKPATHPALLHCHLCPSSLSDG